MAVITEAGATRPAATSRTIKDGVEAVILAGTYHWHRSAFAELRVRPLLPVAQKPLIEFVLGWLRNNGIKTATICGNGSTALIRDHVQHGAAFDLKVRYHEDHTPRGAAGCVRDAAAEIASQTLVVADGTAIPEVDLTAVLAHHQATGASLTIVAEETPGTLGGQPTMQPTGIYVFDRSVLEFVPATSFQDIKEALIPTLYRQGKQIEVFAVRDSSPRVLDAASYLAANHWMIKREAAAGSGDVVAAPTAWVDPAAVIIGPVLLGPGVRVLAGATVVGPTAIGQGSIIESGAVVARSVLWKDCRVGAAAVVDRSILADNAVVPANATVVSAVHAAVPERRKRMRLRARPVPQVGPAVVAKPAWS